MKKDQFIVPKGDQWGVLGVGNSKCFKLYDTQKQAIEKGREIAINQKSELTILGKDGKIREKRSYGNDPCPPKDND